MRINPSYRKWSKEEVDILNSNFLTHSLKELMPLLPGRSAASICCQTSGMGLCKRKNYLQKRWSEEENALLRKVYETEPMNVVRSTFPNRHYNQIKLHAQFLGLKRKKSLFYRAPVKSLMLGEVEKAYLAGLLDGEGSISIHWGRHRRSLQDFSVEISIANTDITTLEELRSCLRNFGLRANLYVQHRGEHNKPVGQLRISNHMDALSFLNAILPYLRIKREKAKLVCDVIHAKIEKQPLDPFLAHLEVMNLRGMKKS